MSKKNWVEKTTASCKTNYTFKTFTAIKTSDVLIKCADKNLKKDSSISYLMSSTSNITTIYN